MLSQVSNFSPLLQHCCPQSSKKDNASEGGEDTAGSEKADAAGSSDEDEGALVIDEKNYRVGTKRRAEESREVGFHPYGQFHRGGRTQLRTPPLPGSSHRFSLTRPCNSLSGVSQAPEGHRGGG